MQQPGRATMARSRSPPPSDASSAARITGCTNRGGSSAASTSIRTRPSASRVADPISVPAISAAWRSSQPSPATASACARPSASAPSPLTRAITARAIPSKPPASNSPGPSTASGRPSRSAALSNSVRYSVLPPQAAYTSAHSSSLVTPPTAVRTNALTAFSLNSAGATLTTPPRAPPAAEPRTPPDRPDATPPAIPPPAPPAAAPGRPASAASAHQPNARRCRVAFRRRVVRRRGAAKLPAACRDGFASCEIRPLSPIMAPARMTPGRHRARLPVACDGGGRRW